MDEPVKTVVTDRAGETERPITVVKVGPVKLILIRVLRTFIQSFLGFAGLLVFGSFALDAGDWAKWLDSTYLLDLWRRILVCAIVALAISLVSLLQNVAEFLARVDVNQPTLRG